MCKEQQGGQRSCSRMNKGEVVGDDFWKVTGELDCYAEYENSWYLRENQEIIEHTKFWRLFFFLIPRWRGPVGS